MYKYFSLICICLFSIHNLAIANCLNVAVRLEPFNEMFAQRFVDLLHNDDDLRNRYFGSPLVEMVNRRELDAILAFDSNQQELYGFALIRRDNEERSIQVVDLFARNTVGQSSIYAKLIDGLISELIPGHYETLKIDVDETDLGSQIMLRSKKFVCPAAQGSIYPMEYHLFNKPSKDVRPHVLKDIFREDLLVEREIKIYPTDSADAENLAAMDALVFENSWSKDAFTTMMKIPVSSFAVGFSRPIAPRIEIYKANLGDSAQARMVGYIAVEFPQMSYSTHVNVLAIAVHPEFNYQAVAKPMLKKVVESIAQTFLNNNQEMRQVNLFVHERDRKLIATAQATGFTAVTPLIKSNDGDFIPFIATPTGRREIPLQEVTYQGAPASKVVLRILGAE